MPFDTFGQTKVHIFLKKSQFITDKILQNKNPTQTVDKALISYLHKQVGYLLLAL